MAIHHLKTWPPQFKSLEEGQNFSIRTNDRDFTIGDTLVLEEFEPNQDDPKEGVYTRRKMERIIAFISTPMARGTVLLGF